MSEPVDNIEEPRERGLDPRSQRNILFWVVVVLILLLLLRECDGIGGKALERVSLGPTQMDRQGSEGDNAAGDGPERAAEYSPLGSEEEDGAALITWNECRRRMGVPLLGTSDRPVAVRLPTSRTTPGRFIPGSGGTGPGPSSGTGNGTGAGAGPRTPTPNTPPASQPGAGQPGAPSASGTQLPGNPPTTAPLPPAEEARRRLAPIAIFIGGIATGVIASMIADEDTPTDSPG